MKKLFITFALLLVSTLGFSQEESKPNYNYYLSAGLSVTNSDSFEDSSYASVELGVMRDNVSLGAILGRNNLTNIGTENFNNYWYEVKLGVYQPVGKVDAYGILGIGAYIDGSSTFLEYGLGVSKQIGALGYFAQVSNWDTVNYISLGVSVPLN